MKCIKCSEQTDNPEMTLFFQKIEVIVKAPICTDCRSFIAGKINTMSRNPILISCLKVAGINIGDLANVS